MSKKEVWLKTDTESELFALIRQRDKYLEKIRKVMNFEIIDHAVMREAVENLERIEGKMVSIITFKLKEAAQYEYGN